MPTHMDANALITCGVICLGPVGVVSYKRRITQSGSVSAYLPDALELALVLRRFDLDEMR